MTSAHFDHLVWYQEAELPRPVSLLVKAHISECHFCQGEIQGEAMVARLVRRTPRPVAPPELRVRIRTQLIALSQSGLG